MIDLTQNQMIVSQSDFKSLSDDLIHYMTICTELMTKNSKLEKETQVLQSKLDHATSCLKNIFDYHHGSCNCYAKADVTLTTIERIK